MKNMQSPLRELIRFLEDMEGRLKEQKCFQQDCVKIRRLTRQLQLCEQFWSDRNHNTPSVSAKCDKWIAFLISLAILAESLKRLAPLAEEVGQVINLLFGS